MGFYYSLQDWHFPGVLPQGCPVSPLTMKLLVEQAHAQVRELLSNYGVVDILWFDGLTTRVKDKVYLLIQRWPGSTVPFAWCGSKVKSACLLANGQYARIEQKGDRVWLHDLPQYPPDPFLSVIELTFDGEPRASEPAYR